MKLRSLCLAVSLIGALAGSSVSIAAHEGHNKDAAVTAQPAAGKLIPATEKDSAWIAEQKAKYPTKMCIVSDEKLGGDMGDPVDYIYRVEGKPDRLVSFCCKDCLKDFNKDPQKYLAILDQAGAGKAKDKSAGGHAKHQH